MHLTIIRAGGEERVCLLDKEETIDPGTMRATGDWVNVNSEQLQYLGRRDRLIKRHGKRVNLDSVQHVSFFPAFFFLSTVQISHRYNTSLTAVHESSHVNPHTSSQFFHFCPCGSFLKSWFRNARAAIRAIS